MPPYGYHLVYSPIETSRQRDLHRNSIHPGNRSRRRPALRSRQVRDVYKSTPAAHRSPPTAFPLSDYILGTGIPDKGKVLTQLSIFWFDFLRDLTPNHFLTAQVADYPDPLPRFRDQLEGRSIAGPARPYD